MPRIFLDILSESPNNDIYKIFFFVFFFFSSFDSLSRVSLFIITFSFSRNICYVMHKLSCKHTMQILRLKLKVMINKETLDNYSKEEKKKIQKKICFGKFRAPSPVHRLLEDTEKKQVFFIIFPVCTSIDLKWSKTYDLESQNSK